MMEWQFHTKSGSYYRVQAQNNHWRVTAVNVPNPRSARWPQGLWVEITCPDQERWPPMPGEHLFLAAVTPGTEVMRTGLLITSEITDTRPVMLDG